MENPSDLCPICGDYVTNPKSKYCSRKCAGIGRRGPRTTSRPLINCETCGLPTKNVKYCSRECFFVSRGWRPLDDPRAPEMIEQWKAGETLQHISEHYGVTRERVRQIIKKHSPNLPTEVKAARREAAFAEKMERERKRAAPHICKFCGATFYGRQDRKYCAECAKDVNAIRMIVDPHRHETHRLYLAIMVLRKPERARHSVFVDVLRRSQEQYRHWLEHGYLSPPNRRYVWGESAHKFLERVGPEKWQEILGNFERYYADTTRRITLKKDPGPLPGLDVNAEDYDA